MIARKLKSGNFVFDFATRTVFGVGNGIWYDGHVFITYPPLAITLERKADPKPFTHLELTQSFSKIYISMFSAALTTICKFIGDYMLIIPFKLIYSY